jgi:hypothetical protein
VRDSGIPGDVLRDLGLPEESLNGNGHAPNLSGAEILDGLVAFIRRFVALTAAQAVLIALWILHTHAFEAADVTPYLSITSAEKRSGKTRLLEVGALLVARPWFTGRVTAAVLVRKTSTERPSLLLDESDAAFKSDKEYSETLRAVLNMGFKRGGVASLCVGQGANIDYKDFAVFSPKAVAGIGRLPDTVADRSIPIELQRRKPSERVERFRSRKVKPEALPLQCAAAAWAEANLTALTEAEPELPEELDDRAQDIVEPLLAIADAVGGEWPVQAREAAVKLLTGEEREDSESLGIRLLRDIRSVFGDAQRLHTTTILEKLGKKDSAPWAQLGDDGLDARGLARLLKPYRIRSKQVRINEDNRKGYEREDFEDAWERYCPTPDTLAETTKHPAGRAEKPVSDITSDEPERNRENPHGNAHVSDVSDNPASGEHARSLTADNCPHGYAGGKGCYVCDPSHPYRLEEARRGVV